MATHQKFRDEDLLTLDDLHVGQTFKTGAHQLTAEEIIDFAGRYDPQPFHLSDEGAKNTLFGTLAASGWHTAAVSMRLMTEYYPILGGIIGSGGELTWPRPTRPGDTLHVESTILEIIPSRSKPDRGMIIIENRTLNQNGEVVQTFKVKQVVPRRV
jgi:acyl dehydratase